MALPVGAAADADRVNRVQREVYGFVAWLAALGAFVGYVCWILVPDEVLERAGITYYPSKYWASALPCFLCVAIMHGWAFYLALNLDSTPALCDLRTVTDERAVLRQGRHRPADSSSAAAAAAAAAEQTPEAADISLEEVCRRLHGQRR